MKSTYIFPQTSDVLNCQVREDFETTACNLHIFGASLDRNGYGMYLHEGLQAAWLYWQEAYKLYNMESV